MNLSNLKYQLLIDMKEQAHLLAEILSTAELSAANSDFIDPEIIFRVEAILGELQISEKQLFTLEK